jgi:hypothetical protein
LRVLEPTLGSATSPASRRAVRSLEALQPASSDIHLGCFSQWDLGNLVRCALAAGAPDLRGIWRIVEVDGKAPASGERMHGYVERIEQCGNRIVDMGGGTIADARADGTLANGVHDVSAFGFKKPIHVIASFEDGVFVLRPVLFPKVPFTLPGLKVTRQLDAEGHMIWTRPDRGGIRVTLERIGGPNDPYTRP